MVILIGITGNIACGKSTVARYWHRNGCDLLDTDQMAALAVAPGSAGYRQVLEAFHDLDRDKILLPDGQLNRRYLGHVVFNDRMKKRQLERIVWPKVYQQLFRQVASAVFRGFLRSDVVVVVEIPQLFESGSLTRRIFDATVVVCCEDEEEQLKRLMARNPDISEEDSRTRLRTQMSQAEKRRLATYSIDNSKGLDEALKQADQVIAEVKRNYTRRRNLTLLVVAMATAVAFLCYFFQ